MSKQSSNPIRRLRQVHRAQRYPGDLGQVVEPRNSGSAWKIAGIAALLTVSAVLGWILAPTDDPALVERDLREVDRPLEAKVETLELPLVPSSTAPDSTASERRPVLPGLLAAQPEDGPRLSGLRLTRLPAFRPPAMTQTSTNSEESTQ